METNPNHNHAQSIATFGSLGNWWIGGIIASLFAIPVVVLLCILNQISQSLVNVILLMGLVGCTIIIQKAHSTLENAPHTIVLDKFCGMILTLLYAPLKVRIIVFGFICFHLLATIRPFAGYNHLLTRIEKLPGALGILGADLFSGLVVNMILQVIVWVTQ